jgi:ABC-type transport system involved in cytochrome c biogenesis ATPase subunit
VTLTVDRVVLRAASAKASRPWLLDLTPGTHALRLAAVDAAVEFARLVAGLERPKAGRVLVAGQDPHGTPALRARIGTQFGRDFTGQGQVVARDFWDTVRELRKRHGAVPAEPLGLLDTARLALPIGQLSLQERRDFELELALDIDNAHAIWLSQPPRPSLQSARDAVLGRLRQRAAGGAIVVVTVATEGEAALWGDECHPRPQSPSAEQGHTILLVVERPREIAAELQRSPVVLGTELDAARPNVLLVHGTDDLGLRRACSLAVVARRCELFEMVGLPHRPTPIGVVP